MTLLDRLEKHLGRYAIPNLIRYVVVFNALVYVLQLSAPGYPAFLELSREAVLNGEVWRLITWIFVPHALSPLFMLIALLFLWFLGEGLESMLGSFRVNVFYLTGMVGCTAAAMVFGGGPSANAFLNLSILFAFATLQPNYTILLFFILPLKIKWLALFSLVMLLLGFVSMPLAGKAAVIVSLANYLLYFGPAFVRQRAEAAKTAGRRSKFEAGLRAESEPMYRCAVCARTELSHPELDFRVAADGNEYCSEHLPRTSTKPD